MTMATATSVAWVPTISRLRTLTDSRQAAPGSRTGTRTRPSARLHVPRCSPVAIPLAPASLTSSAGTGPSLACHLRSRHSPPRLSRWATEQGLLASGTSGSQRAFDPAITASTTGSDSSQGPSTTSRTSTTTYGRGIRRTTPFTTSGKTTQRCGATVGI